MNNRPLISTGNLTSESLADQVAIVTGAGTGIGLEAARALAWLGARVVIAEIDKKAGATATEGILKEIGPGKVIFVQTDIAEERSIQKLASKALHTFGRVDIVLNNAAVEPIGAVKDAPIESWDSSYKVNLRGPVLLARAFLPQMLNRNSGVFVCVSSVGGAYMGPYEVLKRAQVELANTISTECEGTGVVSFVIGPGLVPDTRGAKEQIPKIARMMGKKVEEFEEMSKAALISAEAAGAGFAAAVALASHFRGQEISSSEALHAAGIELAEGAQVATDKVLTTEEIAQAMGLCRVLRSSLGEQLRQWQSLGIFQRQWMTRDFSKRVGIPVERLLDKIAKLEQQLEAGKLGKAIRLEVPFLRLASYFGHLQEMTRDYLRDAKLRDEQILLQQGWKEAAEKLAALLGS
jgi:NAD(P)-dependent dehydrogenase (short-subunit alcohol dehydrogenase family)